MIAISKISTLFIIWFLTDKLMIKYLISKLSVESSAKNNRMATAEKESMQRLRQNQTFFLHFQRKVQITGLPKECKKNINVIFYLFKGRSYNI